MVPDQQLPSVEIDEKWTLEVLVSEIMTSREDAIETLQPVLFWVFGYG